MGNGYEELRNCFHQSERGPETHLTYEGVMNPHVIKFKWHYMHYNPYNVPKGMTTEEVYLSVVPLNTDPLFYQVSFWHRNYFLTFATLNWFSSFLFKKYNVNLRIDSSNDVYFIDFAKED